MTARLGLLAVLIGVGMGASSTLPAQTVTVTTAADVIDIPVSTGTIADLPGPDGKVSFSEAMIATNNTPGLQTVAFAIPQSEWTLQFLFPGRAVLTSITGFYFRAFDEVIIDGTTQTVFTGDTNPNGGEVTIYQSDLFLIADNCTLIGFDSTDVFVTGSGSLVEGNTGSMNIEVSGAGHTVRNNTGGTVAIDHGDECMIVGNVFQRMRVLGPAANAVIGGPALTDRNHFTGYGFWNSQGLPAGTAVQIVDTDNLLLENNWIGTTTDGLASGNDATTIGIRLEGENTNTVIRNNRIAGVLGQGLSVYAGQVFGWAIQIGGAGSGIELVGNTVGLDADGEPTLGSVWGIDGGDAFPTTATDITIGGTAPGEGNVIAGHSANGVTVAEDVDQVRISGNSIYENGALGIDLVPVTFGYGVTPNDPLDADVGGCGLQNFPEIELATPVLGGLLIVGGSRVPPSMSSRSSSSGARRVTIRDTVRAPTSSARRRSPRMPTDSRRSTSCFRSRSRAGGR
ncbi:MAG: right-handed parallel beta-helix repeat-containing protein [Planctomycetes bacterium]|nr:right-handed parallel beta-helix repeat-containing protein [Planctomycetota bacterium]